MGIYENCESELIISKIVLSEEKSKITFVNNKRKKVRKVKIDDCVIKGNEKRCDFLIIRKPKEEIYVELKGNNVDYAIEQIKNTIKIISRRNNNAVNSLDKICFIISTRCPLISAQIQELKISFKRNYKSQLIIKNSPFEYILS